MNRKLLVALAVVGGLSLYLNGSSDDELLAAGKGGARKGAPERAARNTRAASPDAPEADARAGAGAGAREASAARMAPWVADGLSQGVAQWLARANADQGAQATQATQATSHGPSAWASMQPPPPPPPKPMAAADLPPPPPPTAPRFPHAWVGRFNDDALPAAAGVASAPLPVNRAVISGPETTWVVRAGDVIEGQWRVDSIQERRMTLTYLPLNQQQTLGMR